MEVHKRYMERKGRIREGQGRGKKGRV